MSESLQDKWAPNRLDNNYNPAWSRRERWKLTKESSLTAAHVASWNNIKFNVNGFFLITMVSLHSNSFQVALKPKFIRSICKTFTRLCSRDVHVHTKDISSDKMNICSSCNEISTWEVHKHTQQTLCDLNHAVEDKFVSNKTVVNKCTTLECDGRNEMAVKMKSDES